MCTSPSSVYKWIVSAVHVVSAWGCCAPNQPFQAVIRTWWMSQPVKWFAKYMLTLFTGIPAAPQTFTGNEAWLVLGRLRKVMRHKEARQQGWSYGSDMALLILRDTLRRRWERDSCGGSVEGRMRGNWVEKRKSSGERRKDLAHQFPATDRFKWAARSQNSESE